MLPLVAGVFWMRSLASWRPKVVFTASSAITKLELSNDGKTLLVAQEPSPKLQPARARLTALDTSDFNQVWQREDSTDFGNPRFFAGDSKVLVDGGQTMILNARNGQSIREFDLAYGAAISPDGKWIAVGDFDADGRVYINSPDRDIPNGPQGVKGVHVLGKRDNTGRAFEFSPDGKTFVVGHGDKSGAYLDFYDTQTWKRTRSVPEVEVARFRKSNPAPISDLPFFRSVHYSRDGRLILYKCVASRASGISVWRLRDASDAKSLGFEFSIELAPQPLNSGGALRFFSDNDLAIVKPPQFSSQTKLATHFRLAGEVFTAAALSPDGSLLLVGTKSGRIVRKRLK